LTIAKYFYGNIDGRYRIAGEVKPGKSFGIRETNRSGKSLPGVYKLSMLN
jgi:hypothetical protein